MSDPAFLNSTVRRYRIVLTCERTVESATCRSEAWWCAMTFALDSIGTIAVVWRRDPIAAVVAAQSIAFVEAARRAIETGAVVDCVMFEIVDERSRP